MANIRCLFVCITVLSASQLGRPCKVENWQPMTVGEQAREAEFVVHGRVTAHYPIPEVPMDRAYIAEMDVTCVMKGEALPPRINISEAGELTSCHHTQLPVNNSYITFLKRDRRGLLVPDEVNYVSVAFEPTEENFKEVMQAVEGAKKRCQKFGHLAGDGDGDGDGDGGDGRGGDGHDGDGATVVSGSTVFIITMAIMAQLKSILYD